MVDTDRQDFGGAEAEPAEPAAQDEALLLSLLVDVEEEIAERVGDERAARACPKGLEALEHVRVVAEDKVCPRCSGRAGQELLPCRWRGRLLLPPMERDDDHFRLLSRGSNRPVDDAFRCVLERHRSIVAPRRKIAERDKRSPHPSIGANRRAALF